MGAASHSALALLIPLSLAAGCAANPLGQNVAFSRSSRTVASRCAAVLARFDLRHTRRSAASSELHRRSTLAAVFNTGFFGNAYLEHLPPSSQEVPVFVEVAVRPDEEGGFNWFVSWPAVYPAVLYWPIQRKRGRAIVTISAQVHADGAPSLAVEVEEDRPYAVTFYGFFRPGPIETAFREAFEAAYDRLTERLKAELEVLAIDCG